MVFLRSLLLIYFVDLVCCAVFRSCPLSVSALIYHGANYGRIEALLFLARLLGQVDEGLGPVPGTPVLS